MNPLSPELVTGTVAELLVQTRLLQYGVQAAPPLKDSGNDLIAVRGAAFRAIQVKATEGHTYTLPKENRQYHILAAVRLVGTDHDLWADKCEIYLIKHEELPGLSRQFDDIQHLRLSSERADELFPPEAVAGIKFEAVETDASHVINIPQAFPFDRDHRSRWVTFVGEFVMPVMRDHEALYWFTYYGDFGRLRVRCTKREHASIQARIDTAMRALGLQYRQNAAGVREEIIYRLEDDLGGARFLGDERLNLSPIQRGLLVLNLLHAGGQLFINSLMKDGDYWREEINTDGNALKSASRSYLHLLHNQAMSDIPIVLCKDQADRTQVLADYYYGAAVTRREVLDKPDWPRFELRV